LTAAVPRWFFAVALALAACGSGPTAPVDDQAPFEFSFDDPAGDTVAVTELPADAARAVDLVRVSGNVEADKIVLLLEFADPVVAWTARAPNSLDGFVDFDLDESSGTGGADAADGQFGLGVEYYLDLRDDGGGRIGLVDPTARTFTTVAVTFDGTTVRIEIPRTRFEGDDGAFGLGVLVGDRDRTRTDLGPDTGHYTVARP
jgi:hypothetical protein